jgi:hypothetical protein
MIESDVVGWIVAGATTAGSRVSVGSRLQSAALPAVTIDMTTGSRASLGTSSMLHRYSLTINAIAIDMASAQSLAEAAAGYVKLNAALGGGAAYDLNFAAIQEPTPGEGDEMEPAIAVAELEILYPGT